MSKIPYYGKRQNGPYPYNYSHANYAGYFNPYKKNYFKGRPKTIYTSINNYFENRNKNYYYNSTYNSFNNSFGNESQNNHHSVFQKNRNWNRYNAYFTEEKKIAEEVTNDSINEEEKMEELLKIRLNVGDNQCKELILCKNDDIKQKILEFCKDNNINKKLVEPLINKVNQSLNTLEIINNNMTLNKNDFLVLDKVKNMSDMIENN